jgi:hypothetical protein
MAMLYTICFMFTLSTAQWGSSLSRDIVDLANFTNGTADTEGGMATLKNALFTVDMTNALSLINVS